MDKLDHWRSVLTSWTTLCVPVCKYLWSTQPVTLRGRWMSSSGSAAKLKASGAEKETAISWSFPIRYINRCGFNFMFHKTISNKWFQHFTWHQCSWEGDLLCPPHKFNNILLMITKSLFHKNNLFLNFPSIKIMIFISILFKSKDANW